MGKTKRFIDVLERKIEILESLNLNCHKLWSEYRHIIVLRDEKEMYGESEKIAKHLDSLYSIADNVIKAFDIDVDASSELKKNYKKVRDFFTIKNTYADLADRILNEVPEPVVQPVKFMFKLTHFINVLQCDENDKNASRLNKHLQMVSTELEKLGVE